VPNFSIELHFGRRKGVLLGNLNINDLRLKNIFFKKMKSKEKKEEKKK